MVRSGSGQRSFRSTLLFATADEAQLATAREAMRRALARGSIGGDRCQNKDEDLLLQGQMTRTQLADARDKARNGREVLRRPVRAVLIPVESSQAGKSFDLDHIWRSPRANAAAFGLRKGQSQRRRHH